jgi:hypothetical protein
VKFRSSDWWDIASVVGITLVVWLCYAVVASASPVYRAQQIVAQPYAAPVYYKVGQPLVQEATATLQFRHSEEYIELQQLRGFKAGVEAVTASGDRPSSPAGLATKGGDNPAGAEQPASMLKATCAKCHAGEMPKGDLWLDGSVSLEGPDAATKRDAIVGAIRTGKMPPNLPEGERLPPDVIDAIEDELYGVQVVAEPTTPPEGEK